MKLIPRKASAAAPRKLGLVVKVPGQPIPNDEQNDLPRLRDEELEQLERLIECAHSGKLLRTTTASAIAE